MLRVRSLTRTGMAMVFTWCPAVLHDPRSIHIFDTECNFCGADFTTEQITRPS